MWNPSWKFKLVLWNQWLRGYAVLRIKGQQQESRSEQSPIRFLTQLWMVKRKKKKDKKSRNSSEPQWPLQVSPIWKKQLRHGPNKSANEKWFAADDRCLRRGKKKAKKKKKKLNQNVGVVCLSLQGQALPLQLSHFNPERTHTHTHTPFSFPSFPTLTLHRLTVRMIPPVRQA